MTILGGLVDAVKDLASNTLSGVSEALSDNMISDSIGSVLGLLPHMASPITLFIAFISIGAWLIKSSLLIFVVCEAFIMAFSIMGGNPLQNMINYNVSFIGGVLRMVSNIIKIFISILQTLASAIP